MNPTELIEHMKSKASRVQALRKQKRSTELNSSVCTECNTRWSKYVRDMSRL